MGVEALGGEVTQRRRLSASYYTHGKSEALAPIARRMQRLLEEGQLRDEARHEVRLLIERAERELDPDKDTVARSPGNGPRVTKKACLRWRSSQT